MLSGEYVVVAGHLNVGAPPQTIDTFAIDLAKGSIATETAPASAKSPAASVLLGPRRRPKAGA